MQVPVENYLAYSLELTSTEKELVAYFGEWLPDEIVDCHAHSNQKSQVGDISPGKLRMMFTTFPWFTLV